jgi:hypothetical protein
MKKSSNLKSLRFVLPALIALVVGVGFLAQIFLGGAQATPVVQASGDVNDTYVNFTVLPPDYGSSTVNTDQVITVAHNHAGAPGPDHDPAAADVTFSMVTGPLGEISANVGVVASSVCQFNAICAANANGEASITYAGANVGTDFIQVCSSAATAGDGFDDPPGSGSPGCSYHPAVKVWTAAPNGGLEGCTPGFWKNHQEAWINYDPSDDYEETFELAGGSLGSLGSLTLLAAVKLNANSMRAFVRHSVAALLNADHPDVDYALEVDEVIAIVQEVFASGDFEDAKDLLVGLNEQNADDFCE